MFNLLKQIMNSWKYGDILSKKKNENILVNSKK